MSANTYHVSGSAPIQVYPSGRQDTLTLYNSDSTNTVYVGELPNNNGFPMTPGMTLTWDAGRSLYAYCADGVSLDLVVIFNGGTIFSAKSIADQIIAAGLANAIATQIQNSGLTAANIASQINIAGVPPVDTQAVVLDTGTIALTSGTPYVSAVLDVSRYQSLYILLYDVGFNTNAVPDVRQVDFQWYTSSPGGDLIDQDTVFMTDSFGAAFTGTNGTIVETPARGGGLKVTIDDTAIIGNVATNKSTQIRLVILGSYKAMTELSYKCSSSYGGKLAGVDFNTMGPHDRTSIFHYNKAGGAVQVFYPPVIGGWARWVVYAPATAAGNITIEDLPYPSTAKPRYANIAIPVASGEQDYVVTDILLPNRPIRIIMDSTLAAGDIRSALTFLGRN